jgi:hypothetical protein
VECVVCKANGQSGYEWLSWLRGRRSDTREGEGTTRKTRDVAAEGGIGRWHGACYRSLGMAP